MRKSRLSKDKQDALIELFVSGVIPQVAAAVAQVQFTTASLYFNKLRQLILYSGQTAGFYLASTTVDCVNADCIKSEEWHDADCSFGLHWAEETLSVILLRRAELKLFNVSERGLVEPTALVISPDPISLLSGNQFILVPPKKQAILSNADKAVCLAYVDLFREQNKNYMHKLSRMPRTHWYLYLKEGEWRFNHPTRQLQIELLTHLSRQDL